MILFLSWDPMNFQLLTSVAPFQLTYAVEMLEYTTREGRASGVPVQLKRKVRSIPEANGCLH